MSLTNFKETTFIYPWNEKYSSSNDDSLEEDNVINSLINLNKNKAFEEGEAYLDLEMDFQKMMSIRPFSIVNNQDDKYFVNLA